MSVINQMLKDLDKRQEGPLSAHQSSVPVQAQQSRTGLVVFISVLTTLILVALVYLYIENQSLKQPLQVKSVETQHISTAKIADIAPVNPLKTETSVEQVTPVSIPQEPKATSPLHSKEYQSSEAKKTDAKQVTSDNSIQAVQSSAKVNQPLTQVTQNTVDKPTQVAPVIEQPKSNSKAVEPKPALSISRKQLSPEALVTKKMTLAEQAVRENDMPLAEQYFEEILLITPAHSTARKQLAALLYGRQSTQAAINVLAQGIQLAPQDAELRLMSAKIYVERELNQRALTVLSALPDNPDIEYQSLLATTAQSLEQFEQAKASYRLLTQLQTTQGRWYLGLAIAHDSLGDYNAAYQGYAKAISLGGISESAMNFAKQRKLELGE